MQDSGDRRSRKKAQTRAEVRDAAHRLFADHGFAAVTIADVAEEADVAVQTVFNHFSTKEELFFADRTPWVDRPARAVQQRPDDVGPVETLRLFMRQEIASYPASVSPAWRQGYLAVLHDSPDLRSAEVRLFRNAEQALAAAVLAAWETGASGATGLRLSADLVAGQFLSAGRVLLMAQRRLILGLATAVSDADIVATNAAVFDAIAVGLQALDARAGMPAPPVRSGQAESAAAGSTTGSSTSATSSSTSPGVSGTANAV